MDPTKIAIRASTQEHLDIEDIKDDLVILKDGSCCLVIATTAINYGLLSEKEQEAIIYAYAGLLNSLTFPIQIAIRSQRKDVSSYLNLLEEVEKKETRKLIKEQIGKYRNFVQETVQKNEVLDKKFYIVIPMSALELGVAKTLTATFSRRKGLPFEKAYILERAKVNLYPKRDHLLRLLNRLGLKGRQLTTQELIQLFFNVYNPEAKEKTIAEAKEYQAPLVQPTLGETKTPTVVEQAEKSQETKELLTEPKTEFSPESSQSRAEETIQDQIDNLVKNSALKND